MKIAINGFGRIGRTVFRLLQERKNVEVVAVNDITDNEALAYLLRHDTVMGNFAGRAEVDGDELLTDKGAVRMTSEQIASRSGATLIRINPREPQVRHGHIGLALDALEALEAIDDRL